MGSSFWWFYDAVLITVLFGFIYKNAKKGLVKSIIMLSAYIASIIISYPLSGVISEKIYETYIQESSIDAIESVIFEFNIEEEIKNCINQSDLGIEVTDEEISQVFSKASSNDVNDHMMALISEKTGQTMTSDSPVADMLNEKIAGRIKNSLDDSVPEYVSGKIIEIAVNNKNLLSGTMTAINKSPREAALFIEKEYLRGITLSIIRIITFLILFVLFSIILHFVSGSLDKIGEAIGFNKYDAVLGGILGAIEAIIVIFLIVFAIRLLIMLTSGTLVFINDETIENTKLFRHIYNFDISGFNYPN